MKICLIIVCLITTFSLSGQFSPIIDFPVRNFQYSGDPIVQEDGQIVTFELNVFYSIPTNPKGIIYFFHGSGGSARTWLLHVERPFLLAEAYYRGYGIITMDSNNRESKQWDFAVDENGHIVSQNDSHDTEHVWMIHQSLTGNEQYDEDLPLFAVGFSNGGGFVSRLGFRASSFFIENESTLPDVNHIVPFNAVAVYGALGGRARFPQYDLPTIHNVGINDQLIPAFPDMTWHPDWPYAPENSVQASHQALVEKAVDSEFNVKLEETVTPLMFEIIPGIDSSGSVMIYDSLKTATNPATGQLFLTAEDSMTVNPTLANFWKPFVPAEYHDDLVKIEEQLNVAYAGHTVPRIFRDESIDFFERHLLVTSLHNILVESDESLTVYSYPNPFTESVAIVYQISSLSYVDLHIVDGWGRTITRLVAKMHPPGLYEVIWQPSINSVQVPAGIYFGLMRGENSVSYSKIIKL